MYAAIFGAIVFAVFAAFGAVLLTYDTPLRWAGMRAQHLRNLILRKREPLDGFDETLLAQRNDIREALGRHWWQAVLLSAGRLAFAGPGRGRGPADRRGPRVRSGIWPRGHRLLT